MILRTIKDASDRIRKKKYATPLSDLKERKLK